MVSEVNTLSKNVMLNNERPETSCDSPQVVQTTITAFKVSPSNQPSTFPYE